MTTYLPIPRFHSLVPLVTTQSPIQGPGALTTDLVDHAAETMLTRSPTCVPARSPSASPSSFHTTRASSFHYAPASPQKRSPKPTAVSRRQSTSSPLGMNKASNSSSSSSSSTSTSHLLQQQPPTPPSRTQTHPDRRTTTTTAATYVAVDAATQYSPMEPHDYFAPRTAPTKPSPLAKPSSLSISLPAQRDPAQPLQPSQAIPSAQAATHGEPAATSATASVAAPSTPTPAENPPMLKAPHPLSPNKRRNSQGPGSVIEEAASSAQGLPKRPKPETAPPKVLPVRYELCAIEDIVVLIANMLSELIETNDALAMRSGCLTRFHSRTAPGISVLDYLHRLAKHATLIPPLLLSMVYYIDRLCALYPDFTINTLTVHRFLITAATVAAKGLSDSFWNNSTYARVGGVRVAELKLLELEFLHRVDWKIVPDPDVLVAYYRGLVQRSPAYVLEDEVEEDEDVDAETELSDDLDEEEDLEAASESEVSAQGQKPPEITAVPTAAA